jgi:hypothetical protein
MQLHTHLLCVPFLATQREYTPVPRSGNVRRREVVTRERNAGADDVGAETSDGFLTFLYMGCFYPNQDSSIEAPG